VALQKTFACTRDNNSRATSKTGRGGDVSYSQIGWGVGGGVKQRHIGYFDFDDDWTNVGQIVKAELVLTTTGEEAWSFGPTPKVVVGRIEDSWTEGTSTTWTSGDYVSASSAVDPGMPPKYDITTAKNNAEYLDITPLMEVVAPSRVLRRNGNPCGGKGFRGVKIWGYRPNGKDDNDYRTEFRTRHASDSARRPKIILTYDVGKVAPKAPALGAPSGSVGPNTKFTVTFMSDEDTDRMGKVEVRLWNAAGTTKLWSAVFTVSEPERDSGVFTTDLPPAVAAGTTYQWDARTADTGGTWGPFASKKSFTVNNTAPVVTVIDPALPLDTLRDFRFLAEFTDADGDSLKFFRVQVSTETDPGGDWSALLWDSDIIAPTIEDIIDVPYGGGELLPDTTYGYRIMAVDSRNGESAWDYGTFTTSATYMVEGDIEGSTSLIGYNRVRSPHRIVLRVVDRANSRKPGAVTAVITDAANIGVSYFGNSPGDFFFTLPTDHPQVSACEPYQTHWSLQFYRGDQWVEKQAGILIDFDATEEEVIFYGIDYLGLLTFSADERYDPLKPEKSYTNGGSKYSDVQNYAVIRDQIDEGKTQTGSTYGFISLPSPGVLWDVGFSERINLITTFAPTFTTVMGLIESHKQGYGRRPRLWVERTGSTSYRWRLKSNYGQDRLNLRIELGGILNGYRLIGFGAFGTVVHGIGRVKDEIKPKYQKAVSPVNDGVSSAIDIWGRISQQMVWNDLLDENDLKRRVQEAAMQAGKIGKQVAIPIAVDNLEFLDGYDVMDSFPLVINHGVVNTDAYGSGMYTILGVAWRLYPDGHTDLVLSITPKEDGEPVNPDLITDGDPILSESDWQIKRVPPTLLDSGKYWLDQTTGITYMWDQDTEEWVITIADLTLTTPDPPTVESIVRSGVRAMRFVP